MFAKFLNISKFNSNTLSSNLSSLGINTLTFLLNVFTIILLFFYISIASVESINMSAILFKVIGFVYLKNTAVKCIVLSTLSILSFILVSRLNKSYSTNFNSEYLNFLYLVKLINFFRLTLTFYISLNFFAFKFTLLKHATLFSGISLISRIVNQVSWYPIFKRHSIFGFYRISRQRWVELKTEEVNYLKY